MSTPTPRPPVATTVAAVLSMIVQAVLIVIGLAIVLLDASDAVTLAMLALWCGVAAAYTIAVLIVLGRHAKQPVANPPTALQIGRSARVVSIIATIVPSIIGLIAAVQVVVTDRPDDLGILSDLVGVTAMLMSWGLLHWGFAQIYFQRHYLAVLGGGRETVRFPETANPTMVDFVYFAYTIGTAFATSDAVIETTRTRWLVTWHTVISFFFNGLIIVFALSTILGR